MVLGHAEREFALVHRRIANLNASSPLAKTLPGVRRAVGPPRRLVVVWLTRDGQQLDFTLRQLGDPRPAGMLGDVDDGLLVGRRAVLAGAS